MDAALQKTCSRCGSAKPLDAFGVDAKRYLGRDSWCKSCKSGRRREIRATDDGRKRKIESDKKYESTINGKLVREEINKRYKKDNRMQVYARVAVRAAIKSNKLPSPNSVCCNKCGKQAEHYHHLSYENRLDVIPVCSSCHRLMHKQEGGTQIEHR